MNTLATVSMTDPHGKVSECIQFTVDDVTDPFILRRIMTIGQPYTFSLWLMSDIDASMSVSGSTFNSNSAWSKHFVTFTPTSANLLLNFDVVGTYYLYHPQLEIGHKPTDWTPAPDDQAEEINTRFAVEDGKIQAQFTSVNESITDLGEVVKKQYIKTITENENGITIEDSNGKHKLQLDNVTGITIWVDGKKQSHLIGNYFYIGNIVIDVEERAQFGNFAYIPRSDGSLSFLKVGG
jgi:hypothetical protein